MDDNNLSEKELLIKNENLSKENELLFEQVHILQEEIQKLYTNKNEIDKKEKELDKIQPLTTESEVGKLILKYFNLQNKVEFLENSLRIISNNKQFLFNQLFSANESFIKKLEKILNLSKNYKKDIKKIGGDTYSVAIEAYNKGGIKEVDNLFNEKNINSIAQANAYTAIAKRIRKENKSQAYFYAYKAWEKDPQPFRLKWLAFRTYENSNPELANIIISLLPKNTNFSESETKIVKKIKEESQKKIIEKTNLLIKKTFASDNTYIEIIKLKKEASQNKEKNIKLNEEKEKLKDDLLRIGKEKILYMQKCNQVNNEILKRQEEEERIKRENKIIKEEIDKHKLIIKNLEEDLKRNKIDGEEFEKMSAQTANMVKNLFILFEEDSKTLASVLRVVMGDLSHIESKKNILQD